MYIALPFCPYKCSFCGIPTYTGLPKNVIEKYLTAIKDEINLLMEMSLLNKLEISSVSFGGGTPTYLSIKQLNELMVYIKNELKLKDNIPFACETTPEMIVGETGKAKLNFLLENKVNRLSIGIQSFDDDILRILGRKYTAKTAIEAFNNACKAGFEKIGIDLMYGLPNQTLEEWEYTLNIVTKLKPKSIDIYQLRLDDLSIYKTFLQQSQSFPNTNTLLLMKILTEKKLVQKGYKNLFPELFFLPPSFTNKIPKIFTVREHVVGIGMSAYSVIGNFQYYNYCNLKKYLDIISKKQLPICFGLELSRTQRMEREIIKGLLNFLHKGLDKKIFKLKFGVDVEDKFGDIFNNLKEMGFITNYKHFIRLTYEGKLFAYDVVSNFYSWNFFDRNINAFLNKKLIKYLYLKFKTKMYEY